MPTPSRDATRRCASAALASGRTSSISTSNSPRAAASRLAAFAVAFKATTAGVMVIALLAAFGLLLAWLMGVLAARLETRSGDPATIIDPAELARLREQVEARRAAVSAQQSDVPPAP